jgi:hypothetical protein
VSDRAAARRAHRLVRCYPSDWRARYGDEFEQLVIDDITERPRSLTRTADVVRSGLAARLAAHGLTGNSSDQVTVRARLGVVFIASTAFLAAGVAIWAQLTIGWQWSAPVATATSTGMLMMSTAMLGFGILALIAAVPLLWVAGRQLISRRGGHLGWPLLAAGMGGLVLVVGSLHFGHGWPGTGGHPWAGRDVVPGCVARFCWAATLWMTSYWAHPRALAAFPAAEIGWMVVSPLALLVMLLGTGETLRRLRLSPRLLRYESWIGLASGVVMAGFLAGAASWIVSGGPAPRGLFRVGAIDSVGVIIMAAALIVGFGAARRALTVSPSGRAVG